MRVNYGTMSSTRRYKRGHAAIRKYRRKPIRMFKKRRTAYRRRR